MKTISRLLVRFRLRTQVTLLVLGMLAATLFITDWASGRIEQEAMTQVQDYLKMLSSTLEVSVQQLHISSRSAETNLLALQTRQKSRGLRRITLRDAGGRVIATTPVQAGSPEAPASTGALSEVTIPIIAQGRLLGYVDLQLELNHFKTPFSEMGRSRALISLGIFSLGLALIIPFAGFVTRSTSGLEEATRRIASGELDVELPSASNRELASLVENFEQMVAKLRTQKELESRMAESEREAAVGRMAAGIAHDIRNPLNYVKLAVQQLRTTLESPGADPSSPETDELWQGVTAEIEQINRTMRDLLEFGRPGTPVLSRERPSELIEECRESFHRRHPDGVLEMIDECTGSAAEIRVDRTLLVRAIDNLLENAKEASSDEAVVLGCRYDEGSPSMISIWIADRGPGIPGEIMGKLFTPYFTTKASGVGLGLALAAKWVHDMGGELTAENRPDGGAQFRLRFPAEEEVEV
ncbi:MAG: HAMP domain-containing protein [Acidobacteriota bacterium]|nr:MAG: HAMP domain-containing protein [Acidobacteriota bacterium]